MTNAQHANKFYGTSSTKVGGGSLDLSLSNYYSTRNAKLRDDPERLAQSRKEEEKLMSFAQKRNMAPSDVHTALTALRECEAIPRPPEAIETRRQQTLEDLRIGCGSHEAAQKLIRDYVNVTSALAQEVPSLVTRANETGAGEDARMIRALAPYAQEQK